MLTEPSKVIIYGLWNQCSDKKEHFLGGEGGEALKVGR